MAQRAVHHAAVANADWHEREMMELLGVSITGHPNPTRLFLDEELDAGILNEVVPLSVMMNGASTTDLWEHILKDKEQNA
jgi:Ni,Fe-hydrogenase III component G